MGRSLLGALAPEELDRFLTRAHIRALTPYTVTDPMRIKAIVRTDRGNGWSFVRREQAEIGCSLGVPLRDRSGSIVAALGTGWYSRSEEADEARRAEILPHLLHAADEINRALLKGNYDARGIA